MNDSRSFTDQVHAPVLMSLHVGCCPRKMEAWFELTASEQLLDSV
jgi:hypothetical protein